MASSYFRRKARNPYLLEEEEPTAPIGRAVSPFSETFSRPTSLAITQPEPFDPLNAPRRAMSPYRDEAPPVDPLETARAAYQAGAPTTFGGKFKQAGLNALLGFLQGAARDPNNPIAAGLGGAAAGGITSAISPKTGRAYQFETLQRPAIEDRLRREREREDRAYSLRERDLKEQGARADIELKRGQIGELGSRSEIARENARRQSVVAQSQVDLNNARAEAAKTGNPTYVDIDEGGGKITKYQVFPNGTTRPVGASGAAAISRANIKSREGIAARREAGATARAAQREAGGGGTSRREEQDLQRRTSQAAAGIASMERLAREAMESPEAGRGPILNQMRSMAASLEAQFGDLVETGEHNGWPLARLRRREAPPKTAAPSRPKGRATNDPLGIR